MCLYHLVWKPGNVEVTYVGGLDNLPIGKSYLKGAGCLLTTGEPLTKKWTVAPESEIAYSTAQHTLGLSKMVTAIGSSSNFLFARCCSMYLTSWAWRLEVG